MSKFIKLKGVDDETIFVNVPQIACTVEDADEVNTYTVFFAGGANVSVAEQAERVVERASE
jgi:hypothetical protein